MCDLFRPQYLTYQSFIQKFSLSDATACGGWIVTKKMTNQEFIQNIRNLIAKDGLTKG